MWLHPLKRLTHESSCGQEPAVPLHLCRLFRLCKHGASRDAELAPFWVEHYDVAEVRAVRLLTDSGGSKSDEFGGLRPNQFLAPAMSHGGSPTTRMSMCIVFWADLSADWSSPEAIGAGVGTRRFPTGGCCGT